MWGWGGGLRGHAALQLFTAVEADSDPVSPDAAPASSAHSESGLSHRGLFQQRKRERFHVKVYTGCLQKLQKKRKKPNRFKTLESPSRYSGTIQGRRGWCGWWWRWGVSAVVFCTTDSQCTHGRRLSLELCTFPRLTNLVHNWQMQGVKY